MSNYKKCNQKNMKECDKRKSHINSKRHVIYISSNNARHSGTNTFTTLHYTFDWTLSWGERPDVKVRYSLLQSLDL
jgi:hypothetical protein